MYQNIMQNGGNTWTAIVYLKILKLTIAGFDYRVHLNKKGLQETILCSMEIYFPYIYRNDFSIK